MFSEIPASHLYSAYRILAKFERRDTTIAEKAGTAFVVRNQEGELCLVTNRHILDLGYSEPAVTSVGAQLVGVRIEGFIASGGDVNQLPREHVVFEIKEVTELTFAANYDEDVACLKRPRGTLLKGRKARLDFNLNHSDLADDAWIEANLSVCDFIVYPGFPPWYDRSENRPILRTGTIASDPRTNYSHEPTPKGRRVAYEGFSFGGSSGSPIFATQKGFQGGAGIVVTGFRESRLVGINAGHLPAERFGHSGVSYFIKSSAILDLINGRA